MDAHLKHLPAILLIAKDQRSGVSGKRMVETKPVSNVGGYECF